MFIGKGTKPFTGIYISYGNITDKNREIINKKLFYDHQKCLNYTIYDDHAEAYYTTSYQVAKILQYSKNFKGILTINPDSNTRKTLPTVLKIPIVKRKRHIRKLIKKYKGNILLKQKERMIAKFLRFGRAVKIKKDLKKIRVTSSFVSRQELRKLRTINE